MVKREIGEKRREELKIGLKKAGKIEKTERRSNL